jgi:mRNA-degrading endonuclease toxin of MazEF toxin-antitoxin module
MERGEVWIVSPDPTTGTEQRGQRLVVVVSTGRHNRLFTPVVAPITGGGHPRQHGFAVPLTGLGLATQGIVRCDQPRALDLRARGGRFTGDVIPEAVIDDLCARIATIFE